MKYYYSKRTIIIVLLLMASFTKSITLIACAAETNKYNNSTLLCIETEKQALLAFKKSLKDPSHILSPWNDSRRDCCAWDYVVCDHLTGHVREIHLRSPNWNSRLGGMISPSLLNLKHLAYLDLSRNNFYGLKIPSFIGSMASLEYLNLSYSRIQGSIPHNFRNLSSLRSLDLSEQYGERDLNIQSLSGLVNLEYLGLNGVNLSRASSWLEVVNELPNLIELHLSDCNLGHFTPELTRPNFTSLEVLDLAFNFVDSLVPSWIFNLSNLVWLDLGSNSLRGPILSDSKNMAIGNLSSLRILDLSDNEFSGKIRIGNMCSLQELHISGNEFKGDLSDVFMSKCLLASLLELHAGDNSLSGELTEQVVEFQRLEYLSLGYNSFTGSIPFGLGNVSSLTILELEHNRFVGNIPSSLGLLSNLRDLFLGDNILVGNIPSSFGQLSNLESLSLGNNMLDGIVTENHFSNLSKLTQLSASENSLKLSVGEDWNPPFQLENIDLESWILGSQFPSWVQTQTRLDTIGLANTGISGEIPTWFWTLPNLTSLNLSHNHLSGEIPDLISQYVVCLSSNNFSGPLPLVSWFTLLLDLSNNSFSGVTSRTLCAENKNPDLTNVLRLLHLGRNDLSGEIPDCWMNWPSLGVINLGNNNFIGKIPASLGLLGGLRSLNLYNNSLSGKVPSSLQNCTELIKIDLSGNKLEGNIITSPPQLRVLILRSNYFSGQIAPEICVMRDLQVLDVAHNKFSGGIPTCLDNLTFMSSSQHEQANENFQYHIYFLESISLTTKGSELQYDTNLPLFSIIDLSSNRLSGSIPKELTSLAGLKSLNLSGNYLSGSIPDNIGDMASLESLDLSENNISGEIPIGLARLTALAYLNLSYNDLSGQIPTSTQLQSFSPSSFFGNKLCGLPLSDKCDEGGNNNNKTIPTNNKEASSVDMWFYVCMSFGFIAGFWVWWLALIFKESWRYAYFELLDDHLWNKVCCASTVS